VKKLIAILLLSLFLVSTTELYQLLKIPDLIEHYFEHKQLNPDMPLIAFLKAHYEHPVKDGDYGKDQKLPFIIHAKPLNILFTIGSRFRMEFAEETLRKTYFHKIPSKDEDHRFRGFAGSVWEPPRFLFSSF
jgi:hypothetical protein